MTIYVLPTRNPQEHHGAVGWDPALTTFFAHITKVGADEEDTAVLWVGALPPQITDIDELRRLIAPYADLSEELEHQLRLDAD